MTRQIVARGCVGPALIVLLLTCRATGPVGGRESAAQGTNMAGDIRNAEPGGREGQGRVTSEKQAVELFRSLWNAQVRPALLKKPSGSRLDALVRDAAPVVTRATMADACARVAETMGSGLAASTLFGSLERMKQRQGDCWVVHFSGLLGPSVEGYVVAADGAIPFVWEVPEG